MPQRRGVQTLDNRLSRIFTNPRVGGSFGGLDTLWRAVNKDGVGRYISLGRVRNGYVIDDHTRYIDNLNDGFKGEKWLCEVSTIRGRLIWLM